MPKRCECGCEEFSAYQVAHHEIIVDSEGEWVRDAGFVDSGETYGPFVCFKCEKAYAEWWDIPDAPAEEEDEDNE